MSGPHIRISCAVLHHDDDGNVIPCPGYPHVEHEPPTPTPLEEAQATAEDLRYRIRRAREALAEDEPPANCDERLRQAEIRAAVAEHEAEAYRNQVQALVRELLRACDVPEEDLPQKVRVVLLNEEAP